MYNFKNGQKSIFEVGKSLKLSKMQFERRFLILFDFTCFSACTFFYFSVPLCVPGLFGVKYLGKKFSFLSERFLSWSFKILTALKGGQLVLKISQIFYFWGFDEWMQSGIFLRFHGHLNFPWTWTVKFKTSNKLGQLIIIEHARAPKNI